MGNRSKQRGARRAGRSGGFPVFRWNQYSPAGEVERVSGFAQGAANRPGCRRAAFLALVIAFVLIVGILATVALVNVL